MADMNFKCTTEHCPFRGIFSAEGVVHCTAPGCEDRTVPTCSDCCWYEGYSWICYNGQSEHSLDFTDPEDTCPKWRAQLPKEEYDD